MVIYVFVRRTTALKGKDLLLVASRTPNGTQNDRYVHVLLSYPSTKYIKQSPTEAITDLPGKCIASLSHRHNIDFQN